MEFTFSQLFLISLIFIWTGFVRSGLGFGGAALGLPLMLLINNSPLFWLPIIGLHLLFFSALTLSKSLQKIDWLYLQSTFIWIVPAALFGIAGLINFPPSIIVAFIYAITIFYALTWILNIKIKSNTKWLDKILLFLGGYVAGTSLTGAPLIVAVYTKNIVISKLRDTLFVVWFILVSLKMTSFIVIGVPIAWEISLLFLPAAAIGHYVGLKAHKKVLQHSEEFKKIIGMALLLISILGLFTYFIN